MALPVLESNTFELTLPSSDVKVKYRPFLVKEEKILLQAMESKEQKQIVSEKDFICCPYRKKTQDNSVKYSVQFEDHEKINIDNKGLTEIKRGPAGLTMIHRRVYEKLIQQHPDLKIKNYNAINQEAGKYLYNFWETEFKNGVWLGEDVKFCDLVREAGFKFHAVVDGETTHHGTMGYTGKLVDTFHKSNGKAD